MGRPNPELDEAHLKNPQPGDYWEEHFVIYFAVLDVLPNGNIIAVDAVQTNEGQLLDEKRAYEMTPAEMEKQVKYSSGVGFVASVHPNSKSIHRLIAEWNEVGKPYRPWVAPVNKPVLEDPWIKPVWVETNPEQWEHYISRAYREKWVALTIETRKHLWENAAQLTKKG